MDILPLDFGHEMRVPVQLRFLLLPVELVLPIVGNLFQVIDRNTFFSSALNSRGGPAGIGESLFEVIYFLAGDLNLEWLHDFRILNVKLIT